MNMRGVMHRVGQMKGQEDLNLHSTEGASHLQSLFLPSLLPPP